MRLEKSIEKLIDVNGFALVSETIASYLKKDIKGLDVVSDPTKAIEFVKRTIGHLHLQMGICAVFLLRVQ